LSFNFEEIVFFNYLEANYSCCKKSGDELEYKADRQRRFAL